MKKWISLYFALVFVLSFSGCFGRKSEETVSFHGRTFSKADVSGETLEWLEWYNALSEEEQLAISYIPSDLYQLWGYGDGEDIPAETE